MFTRYKLTIDEEQEKKNNIRRSKEEAPNLFNRRDMMSNTSRREVI